MKTTASPATLQGRAIRTDQDRRIALNHFIDEEQKHGRMPIFRRSHPSDPLRELLRRVFHIPNIVVKSTKEIPPHGS